jgi:DNA-binding response OmpR family regulator
MRGPGSAWRLPKCRMSLSDIGLPDYDGYFFLQSLREIPGLAAVLVIVVTARDRLTHEWRCREAGAKLFFQKPIDNRSLSVAIEQMVG